MKKQSYLSKPEMKQNVDNLERIVSLLGGAYLLYDALKKEKRSIPEIGAAAYMIYRGVSGYCPALNTTQKLLGKAEQKHNGSNINIHVRMVVNRPVNEVYNFWRHLGNLPLFMEHLDAVTVLGETHSEWRAKLPGGIGTVGWKAEIVLDEPYRHIGWASMPGSTIKNAGKVTFKDAGELGTLVHVVFSYEAPLGVAGEEVARMLNPIFEKTIRKDILAFKRYMETGTAEVLQQETVKIYG